MRSHEALQNAIAGKTGEHAKELHLSTSQVGKWQEPCGDWNDSGSYNPLDRIEAIVRKAQALKSPGALDPIYYLCENFNMLTIAAPSLSPSAVTKDLLRSVEEFGRYAQEASADINNDGKIDPMEASRIRAQGMAAIRSILTFVQAAENAAKTQL